jgi:hypothetical protein
MYNPLKTIKTKHLVIAGVVVSGSYLLYRYYFKKE